MRRPGSVLLCRARAALWPSVWLLAYGFTLAVVAGVGRAP